jgi:hypothetical protein
VASGLERHGLLDLLDREGRGHGHGELAGKDRVGDPFHVVQIGFAYDRWIDTTDGQDLGEIARRTLGELQAASVSC